MKETISSRPQWLELILVSTIVLLVSAVLFWRFLPLPHQDLNFYTEPAFLLATTDKLAGPASQAVDLTYQKGIYSYPPGYFLILAGWLRLFGLSADSLLTYTHLVHAAALIMLWMLLRRRYSCSVIVSVFVMLAFFPRMVHGRPDLTGVALSLAAWLALPEEIVWARILLSGCLAGTTLLVSPGFGVGIISTLVILMLLNARQKFKFRMGTAVIWLGTAGVFFSAITAIFLTLQHSWTIAYVQFKTNSAIRGAEVNVWPNFHLRFTWAFCVVPFFLVAILPALFAIGRKWRVNSSELRALALAFLGGTAVWLALNKSQLLLDHHFLFPAKSVFLGVFCSRLRFPAWVRVAPLALLSLISFYYHKPDFLYLGEPLRLEERKYAAEVKLGGVVAADSLYFARFYRPGQTLNYEVFAFENYWPRYLAAIPAFARPSMLEGLLGQPMKPDLLLISAYTVSRSRDKSALDISCEQPQIFADRLYVLGRTWNLPAQPYALMTCHPRIP